ncbi:MAG: DUF1295 domain-containing protein [Myxococcales bacterium]|nr:DUF1295 domain-containing protein [Myxococcales bacterium]MCB9718575.1 DUF1295 domain-containing protein [Myxococcales bacterium]
MSPSPEARGRGRTIVIFVYLAALVAAWATVRWLPEGLHLLWVAAIADVVATLVVFGFSVVHDNSSMYDPYWSVAPLVLAPWLCLQPEAGAAVGLRQALVLAVIYAWGLRLTFNWLRHWRGMPHEDWRYVDLRRQTGRAYWLVSLLGIHLFPTFMVFAGCLCLWPALVTGSAPLGALDGLALATCAGAIAIEAVADRQLHEHRRAGPPPERILDTGLWGWSRHPNYFGEIALWWGLCAFGLTAAPGTWWPLWGPALITVMFVAISIPMIEKRMHARRPAWAEHCRRVSLLVPRPPRRGAR